MPRPGWVRELGYKVRDRLSWSPRYRGPRPRPFDADCARLSPEAAAQARALLSRWPALAAWSQHLTFREWHEALFVLDSLAALAHAPLEVDRALDVGSKNGAHLPALHAYRPVPWTMVELDAHRRYGFGVTRRGRAEALVGAYPGASFQAGSVTDLGRPPRGYGLITWTLPFVFVEPLRGWGLPDRFFAPEALLAHVLSLLSPGGCLFIVNQGEVERDEQARLLRAAGVEHGAPCPLDSVLSPFRRRRWAFRVRA
jgi:hypothetical protein